jgi:outer membrane receptor protein involved in Fe transport
MILRIDKVIKTFNYKCGIQIVMKQNFKSLPGYFKCRHFAYVSLLFLITPQITIAASVPGELNVFELSLQELSTIRVASKKDELIEDAPGIITVVSSDEIRLYGARTLRDILDRQPHLQIIGSNLLPHNKVSSRGVASSHIDNTVLLLINGRPIREPSFSSVNNSIYEAFPISTIEQIEIIRGPGSVLYGTNAMSAVINIVTKEAPEQASGKVELTYGSFDTKQGELSGGANFGEFQIFGAIKGIKSEGDDFNNIFDESGSSGTYKTGLSGEHLLLNAKYKGLSLNILQSDTRIDNARSTFVLPSTTHDLERQFIDIGYEHKFTKDWRTNLNFTYHHHNSDLVLNAVPTLSNGEGNSYLFELNTQAKLNNKLYILLGGTYNAFDNRGSLIYDTYRHSFYTQADYQVFKNIKLTAGLQYNKPKETDGDISPRLALTSNINQNWKLKLLYSKAFREASPLERFINLPTIVGDPSLESETIDTFDAQIIYQDKNKYLSATYFHSEQKDIISRVAGTPVRTINSGELIYDGFEIEGRYNFMNGLKLIGNMSYQTNEQNNGNNDVTYSPDWMFKTGLSYDSNHGYQFSVFNSYFARSTLQNHQIATVTATNPDAEGYNLLTANLNLNLGGFLNNASLSNTTLSLYGDNLLDEDIFFPSINRTSVNSIPHHAGRGIYGTIRFNF